MADVYVVLVQNRHADPDVVVFEEDALPEALQRARDDARDMTSHPEDPDVGEKELNQRMITDGWVWYAVCSVERDSVTVLRRPLVTA